jgi:hypothetical protein
MEVTVATVENLGLLPGDVGFTRIGGKLGWWITLGQLLTGDANKFTHTFLVLDNGEVAEAMPSGARIQPLNRKYASEVAYVKTKLTDEQRSQLVREVREALARPGGIKYSFADYLAIALVRLGIKPARLKAYVANSGRMICSQFVDYFQCRVGFHIFNDGRLSQDVTPGGLFFEMLEHDLKTIVVDPTREGVYSEGVS